MQKTLLLLIGIIISFSLLILSLAYLKQSSKSSKPTSTTSSDTITILKDTTIIDTIHINHFRETTKKVTDTMLILIHDTIRVHDSIFLAIERESKIYTDSLFSAWISGYKPSLDSIILHLPTREKEILQQTTTAPVKPPKWSIGIGINTGIGHVTPINSRKSSIGTYIGIGIGVSRRF